MKILNAQSKNFYSKLDKIISKRNKIDKTTLKTVEEIIDKKKVSRIKLIKNDKIEIVHFIGGG